MKATKFKLTNPKQKESEIQKAILRALGHDHVSAKVVKGIIKSKSSGIFEGALGMFWRANSGSFIGANGRPIVANPAGTADIIGCVNGRFAAIEVKAPGESQIDSQRVWQSKVESAGGLYAVVCSVREAIEVVSKWAGIALEVRQ